MAFAVVAVFMANFPAVEVPHAGMQDGKYGPHFECRRDFEHGWPFRYARRDNFQHIVTSVPIQWKEASAWTPFDGVKSFYWTALLIDAATALAAVATAAFLAQRWRSRRRSVLQPRLIDLLGLVALVAATCAWIGHDRLQRLKEEQLLRLTAENTGGNFDSLKYVERGCAVPAFLPKAIRDWYEQQFGHVLELRGAAGSDVASEFRHLLVLEDPPANRRLRDYLRHLPNIEAIDWCMCPIHDSEDPIIVGLHDLPPMLNLRGINLYETDANDGDLAWLGKCPRLERIDLFDTEVTDVGVQHLSPLRWLRILEIKSEHLTDEACKAVAKIDNLEELFLENDKITDRGILYLKRLQRLRIFVRSD